MASITAVLCVLFSSAQIVYPVRKLGASGDECSGVIPDYVNKVVRIRSARDQNSTKVLGNGCQVYNPSSCGSSVPVLGYYGIQPDGGWIIVQKGQTVMLKSCWSQFKDHEDIYLHSPLGQRHGRTFKMSSSTSVGSRWCMKEQGGKVYFQSARSGRFLFNNGSRAVVGNDHQAPQTQWEVSISDYGCSRRWGRPADIGKPSRAPAEGHC